MAIDPYRALGLPPGSSAAEVKRAYRRLAKANHPDSAGPGALPRFLEIQRAYETLTNTVWRPGMRRPAPSSPTEPWRADSTRARSAGGAGATAGADAQGARAPGGPPPGAKARTGPTTGSTGSTRPTGRPGTKGSRRPSGDTGASGARASGAGSGSGTTGRRRTSKKATFGSTTYDEAKESTDTRWAGASWYGPSSGEYWRVNPREYADPRKHGPEYLAKAAARAAAAAERRARQDDAMNAAGRPEAGEAADDQRAGTTGRQTGRQRPGASSPEWTSRAERERQARRTAEEAAVDREPVDPPWMARRREPAWNAGSGQAATGGAGVSDAWGLSLPSFELGPGLRRLLRALIAWPPLGIAAAALIGEATGCAAFEATCAAPADLYPWFAQGAIILALLAVPGIARILAGGTLAVLVLAFPVAAVLSASGATYDRTYGPAALMAALAIAWAVGVAAVVMRRAVTRTIP